MCSWLDTIFPYLASRKVDTQMPPACADRTISTLDCLRARLLGGAKRLQMSQVFSGATRSSPTSIEIEIEIEIEIGIGAEVLIDWSDIDLDSDTDFDKHLASIRGNASLGSPVRKAKSPVPGPP